MSERKRFIPTWEVSVSIFINQEEEPTGSEDEIKDMLIEEAVNGEKTVKISSPTMFRVP